MALLLALSVIAAPATLVLEVQAPDAPRWTGREQDVARIAASTLSTRTRLVTRNARTAGLSPRQLQTCRGQPSLRCWVQALTRPPRSTAVARRGPYFMLVRLLPLPREDQALVSLWLVDLERARQGLREHDGAAADRWILERATTRRRFEVVWGDGTLPRAFRQLWDDRAERLRGAGLWWPNGSIRVQTDWVPPYQVSIDGGAVRTATASTVIVRPVAAGTHRVIVGAGRGSVARTVNVTMGRTTDLRIDARAAALRFGDDRPALLWSGIGVAAAGVAITVAGLTLDVKSELVQVCAASSTCDDAPRFARSSDYFTARETPNGGSGPLVVPLGYSLAITGGAWALTAALWDEPQVPWWIVVLGGVAGGAAYGLSEALQ